MSGNYPAGVTDADFDEPEMIDCPECDGAGQVADEFNVYDCSECKGEGQIKQLEEDL